MVPWGGLMTAPNDLMPNMPRFDTAVVPPWYSSGLSFLVRARAARSFISAEMVESVFCSARRITGVNSPPSIATATPTSE